MPSERPLIILCHGITEYKERYNYFINYMEKNDIDVYVYDIQGFGARKNEEGKSWSKDVRELIDIVSDKGKDRETYIIGFSLGSFILRCAMPELTKPNYHFILIGTGQQNPFVLSMVEKVMTREVKKHGYYTPTPLTRRLLFEEYNKKFGQDTMVEWLIKDDEARNDYLNDKNILLDIPCGYFRDMLSGMQLSQRNKDTRKIVNIAGEEDPVGNFGKDFIKLKKQYPNLETHIFKDERHDVLHDTNKEETFDLIIDVVKGKK